jgi:hypothetical protein
MKEPRTILADAMTPDAASTQPRKRRWKRLIVALACVVAVVTIVLLATPPKPEPVKVWFVGYTNDYGRKWLVFAGTNGTPIQTEVDSCVVTGEIWQVRARIPNYQTLVPILASLPEARTSTPRGECFRFTLPVPHKEVPYCVIWYVPDFVDPAWRYGRLRWGCYKFLVAHHMPRLAQYLVPYGKLHYIPSTEIKE